MTGASSCGGAAEAPVITQGQTTSVGADVTALEEAPVEPVQEAKAPSIWDNWLLFAVLALWIWYFFGNKKRKLAKAKEKQEQERRERLEKGDEIVTIGRMHATVTHVGEATVTVKPDPKSDYTMTFDRQAILRVLPRPGEEEEEPAKK